MVCSFVFYNIIDTEKNIIKLLLIRVIWIGAEHTILNVVLVSSPNDCIVHVALTTLKHGANF
jgi:hypothetical protein